MVSVTPKHLKGSVSLIKLSILPLNNYLLFQLGFQVLTICSIDAGLLGFM